MIGVVLKERVMLSGEYLPTSCRVAYTATATYIDAQSTVLVVKKTHNNERARNKSVMMHTTTINSISSYLQASIISIILKQPYRLDWLP